MKNEHSYALDNMWWEKRGEGRYRNVYSCGDNVVKVLKPYVSKKYGQITVRIPTAAYVRLKFLIADFNRLEYENYSKLMGKIQRT